MEIKMMVLSFGLECQIFHYLLHVLVLGLTAYSIGCLPKSHFLPSSLKIEPLF